MQGRERGEERDGRGAFLSEQAPCLTGVTGLRASYSEHVYDFFKPQFSVPYPAMDGRLSVKCYLRAAMNCYDMYCKRFQQFKVR